MEEFQRICITGGPGSGKTTLISRLKEEGYSVKEEVSREIILEARKKGVEQPFLNDPTEFSRRLMEQRIKQFVEAGEELVFYDRGIPDVIAYHHYQNTDYPDDFYRKAKKYRYAKVFILPPWKEIYQTDNERYENFEQAVAIHDNLLATYKHFGYSPVEVKIGSLQSRMNQILSSLGGT